MTTSLLAAFLVAAIVGGAILLLLLENRRFRRERDQEDRAAKLRTIGQPHSLEEWRARAAASQARSDARRDHGT